MPYNFSNITPADFGFASFDVIDQVPGIDPQDKADIMRRLQELDALKAPRAQPGQAADAFESARGTFQDAWSRLVGGSTYVPPPQIPQPPPINDSPPINPQGNGAGAAAVNAPPDVNTPSLLGGIDFEAELKKLLDLDPTAQQIRDAQGQQVLADLNTNFGFGENDQRTLDIVAQRGREEAQLRDRELNKAASGVGLRGSGQEGEMHRGVTKALTQQIMDAELSVRQAASERGERMKSAAFQRASDFATALETKNVALAQALLQAHQSELDAELRRTDQQINRDLINQNLMLERDRFTEEQRKQLKSEGFTEQQISLQEQQMLWERAFNITQQTADIDLANKNLGLQEKILANEVDVQGRQLSQEDRRIALQEIKNNHDMSLEDAMSQYTRDMGLADLGLKKEGQQLERDRFNLAAGESEADRAFRKEEFDALQKRLEREFGLELNRFALEESVRTGQLNLDILNSQRKYDLDSEDQKQKWMATEAARQLEEKLGIGKLDLERYLGDKQISLEEEKMALEKWMFSEGLAWDQKRFEIQLQAARKKSKKGCLKSVVGAVVGAGVGLITTGNPVGALIGGASSVLNGMGQGGALDQILNWQATRAGQPGPVQNGTSD